MSTNLLIHSYILWSIHWLSNILMVKSHLTGNLSCCTALIRSIQLFICVIEVVVVIIVVVLTDVVLVGRFLSAILILKTKEDKVLYVNKRTSV